MSVGEDQTECPLCMEPLEMDDINFFPCTCGYQICRFCWHRIRTDENGLCPACRKAYPEDPAEFKPLTEDELQRIKKERRQKEAQRKQKAAENRKHLANVRVVQKNLVFVVGLSQRLADPEVLRKHEYFGKFGKIHKVVINQSTSYAGAQGPSASAYVTYHRPEDALKAIQAVNNIHVDGRTLKASLGTTKYCSHFLRGAQCPKPDCMYLHELGEEAASFTKEEMQQGKHQEYEQKLYELYMNSQNLATTSVTPPVPTKPPSTSKKNSSPVLIQNSTGDTPPPQTTKEAWPSLQAHTNKLDTLTNGNEVSPQSSFSNSSNGSHSHDISSKTEMQNAQNRAPGFHRNNGQYTDTVNGKQSAPSPDLSPGSSASSCSSDAISVNSPQQFTKRIGTHPLLTSPHSHASNSSSTASTSHAAFGARPGGPVPPPPGLISTALINNRKLPFQSATDSMSLFSSANGFPANRNPKPLQNSLQSPAEDSLSVAADIPDTIPVSTSTDWQAAFGFTSTQTETHDDDLGFDPWNESAKGLAEIIEKEGTSSEQENIQHRLQYSPLVNSKSSHSPMSPQEQGHPVHHNMLPVANMHHTVQQFDNRSKPLPPGFAPNHINTVTTNQMMPPGSKIMNLMHFSSVPPHDVSHNDLHAVPKRDTVSPQTDDVFNTKDWQDGLRALLPNINISFGTPQTASTASNENRQILSRSPQQHQQQQQHPSVITNPHQSSKYWASPANRPDVNWDPAIVTSGNIADNHSEETPHWMASLHHLTEDSVQMPTLSNSSTSHQVPLVQQLAFHNTGLGWPAPGLSTAPHPPPGFRSTQLRPHTQVAPEVTQLADGFQ